MIREELQKLVEEAAGQPVSLSHPENPDHGDYSTNIALILAKKLNKNAREIAEGIVLKLAVRDLDFLASVKVEGPGFINFFLSNDFFLGELRNIVQQKEKYGQGKSRKKIIVEYSSPNIAKPFGIGHLRSTIIGQAIYNLYAFLGYSCIGINYAGDWGTPHGKILYKLSQKPQSFLKGLTVAGLEKLYVEFHKEAAAKPHLEEEARAWFKKLEQGDKTARKLWEYTRKLSLKEFQRIYKLLNVRIDHLIGESFFEHKMAKVVQDFKHKGLAKESKGALVVFFANDLLAPAILLKSDRATTYFTRDLANIRYRVGRWKPDIIVIETGAEQILHFQQVFLASKLIGYTNTEELVHVHHGLYRSKYGKFSTRKGNTIHLEDVLKKAVHRAKTIVEHSQTLRGLGKKEKDQVAQAVGIGAIKYNDLSQDPRGDIVFDWKKMLNLKGNSGPYLQYTYARCKSILRHGLVSLAGARYAHVGQVKFEQEELVLLRTLYTFAEVVQDAAQKFSPNLVCSFAFDVAQKYNLFYNTHRVVQAEKKEVREFRLLLTTAVAHILNNSLSLLGIQAPERM